MKPYAWIGFALLVSACAEPPSSSDTTTGVPTTLPPADGDDDGNTTDSDPTLPNPDPTVDPDDTTTDVDTTDGDESTSTTSPPPPAVCGNNILEDGETCDLSQLDGATCESLGHTGGTLACFVNCQGFNTEGCFICGNSIVESDEDCEGSVPMGVDCSDVGFDSGPLTCGADCFYDTSQCTLCGNGILEAPESCDGDELGGQTCAGLGFDGGELACNASCSFDFAGCTGTNLSCVEVFIGNVAPQSVQGSTVGEDDDFAQSCVGPGSDHLIGFIAPSAGNYLFDTIGSAYDTALSLHQDCDGFELECNDDGSGAAQCGGWPCSELGLFLNAGEAVIIAVTGFDGQVGAYTLNVAGPF